MGPVPERNVKSLWNRVKAVTVIGMFGLGLTLESLSQVMKRPLVSSLLPIWKENLMDVFPLQRAIGFWQYGGPLATP